MSERTPGRPRKKPARAETSGEASPRVAPAAVDQYIAGQLKAIYDEVVAERITDRLLQAHRPSRQRRESLNAASSSEIDRTDHGRIPAVVQPEPEPRDERARDY
jgi:hypothetical protein